MSKVYKCDSCGVVMEDPYSENMKEFYIGADCDMCGVFPMPTKRKQTIHLCDDCYKGLHRIARKDENKADAVEVVRCKDCVYTNEQGTICRYGVGRDTKPNGYCHNGERKGDTE